MRGGIDPRNHPIHPRIVGIVHVWKDLCFDNEALFSPGGAGHTNLRQVGVSTLCLALSTRGMSFCPPGLLELQIRNDDPWIGCYIPCVTLTHAGSISGIIPRPYQLSRKS